MDPLAVGTLEDRGLVNAGGVGLGQVVLALVRPVPDLCGERQHALQQRDLDVLAPPGAVACQESSHDPHGHEEGGPEAGHRTV